MPLALRITHQKVPVNVGVCIRIHEFEVVAFFQLGRTTEKVWSSSVKVTLDPGSVTAS